MGVESVIASNGLEALKILEQNSNDFELFLLDLTMPIISGEETCQKIMKINENAKVILMSGFSEYELKMKYSQKGFSDFLQKPFTFETFKQKIFNTIGVLKECFIA
jgi:two-component system response regulator YesN